MKEYKYKMWFSPYSNMIRATNYKDARERLAKTYPEYDVKKVVQYLSLDY